MKKTSLLVAVLLVSVLAFSQDTIFLKLDEAIASAVANSDAAKISHLDEQISQSKYKQTNAIFLPQVNFSYTSLVSDNPLNAFGFKLQQQSVTMNDFDPAKLNQPSSTYDFTTKLELRQPVFNPDLLYQRKAAAVQTEMYRLISQRTSEGVAFETEKAYLNLQMLYSAQQVLEQALRTANWVYKSTKDYFDQGLVQKSDLLNAEVHLLNIKTQKQQLHSNIADASDQLSFLMGKAPGQVYTADTIAVVEGSTNHPELDATRSDLAAMQKGVQAYDLMIRSSKTSLYPKLNAFASYQLNDNNPLGFNAGSYLAGIQLSWSLFNGNRIRNTIAQQTLEKDKLTSQLKQKKGQEQLQINHAYNQLNDAWLELQQREKSVQQASEALRVLQNRYQEGLVKTTDVLMSQTQLAQQKMNYVQAAFRYNLAGATLRFLTKK